MTLARMRLAPVSALEIARAAVVAGCGLALALAGQPLPF
jgi:hypothetical protein